MLLCSTVKPFHFTGTLDNWDPAVTDPLATGREVILFESAGLGRSSGKVSETVAGMASHAFAFVDGLGLTTCDVLGFSLGDMVAQQIALDRPSLVRKSCTRRYLLPPCAGALIINHFSQRAQTSAVGLSAFLDR
jgi:hypothetical protein